MSGPWGVTPLGFVLKQLADIKADLEAGFQAVFGAGINLTPQSRFGQIIGIFSERFAQVWELGEAVHNARNPDAATGASLDEVMALTGAQRLPPERSTVTGTATGTAGTLLPAGRVISVQGTGVRFRTTADATITAGSVDIPCESEDYGPFLAPAGLLTKIETPVAGWTAFTNAHDAIAGRGPEDDSDARLRREQLLRAEGNAAVEAVRSRVLRVTDVNACIVFENVTEAVGAYGLPPKSIEVLVLGGKDDDIRAAIWQSKPGGIETFGGISGSVVGSDGLTHPISFSRPTERDVFIVVTVTRDPDAFPSDGVLQIKERLVDYAEGRLLDAAGVPVFPGYRIGDSVIQSALYAPIFRVSGLLDVTALLLGFAANPTSNQNLLIGARELARFDTSRITVTLKP